MSDPHTPDEDARALPAEPSIDIPPIVEEEAEFVSAQAATVEPQTLPRLPLERARERQQREQVPPAPQEMTRDYAFQGLFRFGAIVGGISTLGFSVGVALGVMILTGVLDFEAVWLNEVKSFVRQFIPS